MKEGVAMITGICLTIVVVLRLLLMEVKIALSEEYCERITSSMVTGINMRVAERAFCCEADVLAVAASWLRMLDSWAALDIDVWLGLILAVFGVSVTCSGGILSGVSSRGSSEVLRSKSKWT